MSEHSDKQHSKCPTCESPDPTMHPAMQFEGEIQPCSDSWHKPTAAEIENSWPQKRLSGDVRSGSAAQPQRIDHALANLLRLADRNPRWRALDNAINDLMVALSEKTSPSATASGGDGVSWSETPQCDALELDKLDSNDILAWKTLARRLERELAEAKRTIIEAAGDAADTEQELARVTESVASATASGGDVGSETLWPSFEEAKADFTFHELWMAGQRLGAICDKYRTHLESAASATALPVEPTPAMVWAGEEAMNSFTMGHEDVRAIWKAMLAKAPQPEARPTLEGGDICPECNMEVGGPRHRCVTQSPPERKNG